MNKIELRDKIKKLKPLPENAARFSWMARRIGLRERILNAAPEKFLTWPVIKETMFIGNGADSVQPQLEWIFWPTLHPFWYSAIQENDFGRPETFLHDRFGKTSGNLVNQAYYLKRWGDAISLDVNQLTNIVEFGGGYGAMATICHRLGFTGQYTIIDLPEYLLLQEYYLSNVLDDINNINFVNTFDDYEIDADLAISICALSEVAELTKDRFFEQVQFKHHLFVFQPDWGSWDNRKYFIDMFGDESVINPYFVNHQYMVR